MTLSAALPAQHMVFVLLPRFSLLPVAGAVEALRLANRLAGRALYRWTLASAGDGDTVASSAAIPLPVVPLPELRRDDCVLICGGVQVAQAVTPPLLAWLRRGARSGATLGALCTGAHVLARAGLLDGRRATIHWENHDGFTEDFDTVDLTRSVFVVDGNRVTAAGGSASVDLMLRLIASDHGEALAASVADQLIHATIRTDRDTQRLSIPTRIGVRHPKLSQVIARMEAAIEDPVSPALLAAGAGLSTRQLERLFRRYLSRSPKRYYMELRLARARNLLMQTEMSVTDVALACGFASPSHFSRCYRAQYQITPYRERGAQAPRD